MPALYRRGRSSPKALIWRVAAIGCRPSGRSSALRAHAVTTYNIAYCERALGRYTRARKMFAKALAQSAAHGDAELPDDLASSAKTYLGELERQIARSLVSLSPEDATILVDGRPLERAPTDAPRPVLWAGTREPGTAEPAPASMFELHVDPGSHVFVVSKSGYADDVRTRTFDPGSEKDVVVTLSPVSPAAPAAILVPPPSPAGREVATTHAHGPSPVPLYVGLGVGGAGLATGVTALAVAIGFKDEGDSSKAGTAADVATGGFIAGGAGVAFALVYWWLTRDGAAAQPAASRFAPVGSSSGTLHAVRIIPWATPNGAGVVGTF
jgi:hypothetical protein